MNFGQDLQFYQLDQLYNQNLYADWSYFQYYLYANQFTHTFEKQQPKADESSNGFSQVKKQERQQFIQIYGNVQAENPQRKNTIKTQQKNRIEDANYMNKSQKDDRNLNSIVIRNFVNYVNGHPNLLKILGTIIQKRNLNISAQHFRDLFRSKFPARQPYIGVGKLKSFIETGKQHLDVRIITLILLRKFISADFFTVLLNSRKVSQSAKGKELKHGRKFWKDFCLQYM